MNRRAKIRSGLVQWIPCFCFSLWIFEGCRGGEQPLQASYTDTASNALWLIYDKVLIKVPLPAVQGACGKYCWHFKWSHIRQLIRSRLLCRAGAVYVINLSLIQMQMTDSRVAKPQVAAELARVAPIQLLRPNMQPWKGGVLSLDPVVERLRQLLPATFEELPVPLAVGVVDQTGKHMLIRSGPLPEAVAASAAIPMVFAAVDIPGKDFAAICNTSANVIFTFHTLFKLTITLSAVLHKAGQHSTIVGKVSETYSWQAQKLCCACRCCCWTSH